MTTTSEPIQHPTSDQVHAVRIFRGKTPKVIVTIGDETTEFGGKRAERANYVLVTTYFPDHGERPGSGEETVDRSGSGPAGLRVSPVYSNVNKIMHGYRRHYIEETFPVTEG